VVLPPDPHRSAPGAWTQTSISAWLASVPIVRLTVFVLRNDHCSVVLVGSGENVLEEVMYYFTAPLLKKINCIANRFCIICINCVAKCSKCRRIFLGRMKSFFLFFNQRELYKSHYQNLKLPFQLLSHEQCILAPFGCLNLRMHEMWPYLTTDRHIRAYFLIISCFDAFFDRRSFAHAQEDKSDFRSSRSSSTLVIMTFLPRFQGNYTCVASNVFRMKKLTFYVNGTQRCVTFGTRRGLVVRTFVFGRRIFHDLCLIYGW